LAAVLAVATTLLAALACKPGGDLLELKMGDCVENPGPNKHTIHALHKTDCADADALRVARAVEVWSDPKNHDAWPGDEWLTMQAQIQCTTSSLYYVKPTEDSWDIDHRIICFEDV
jgi:hypothetical protein